MYLEEWPGRLPFEYRPVTRFTNTRVRINSKMLPNGYMIDVEDCRLSLIFDTEIFEYKFDDRKKLDKELLALEGLGIRKISIRDGLLKFAILSLALVAALVALSFVPALGIFR